VFEGVIQRFEPAQSTMRDTGAAPASLSSQAFDELFLSTYPRLVRILRRMLGDSGRAEEIAKASHLGHDDHEKADHGRRDRAAV